MFGNDVFWKVNGVGNGHNCKSCFENWRTRGISSVQEKLCNWESCKVEKEGSMKVLQRETENDAGRQVNRQAERQALVGRQAGR